MAKFMFQDANGKEIGTRKNGYNIDPKQVVIKPELNGRHELPEIETLIADMLSKPDGHSIKGQTTPVVIRKDGKLPVLVAGHRRLRAILEINKRKLTPEPLPLLCSYMQLSEVEALAVAVTENRERCGITPIDEAYNVKMFLRLGKDHEWIARNGGFFPGLNGDGAEIKKAIAWVKKREKLLGLTEEAQQEVSSGKIKISAAEHLAELQAEKQRDLIEKGQTSAKEIREASGKPSKLTTKQVKEELDNVLSELKIGEFKLPAVVLDWIQSLRDKI